MSSTDATNVTASLQGAEGSSEMPDGDDMTGWTSSSPADPVTQSNALDGPAIRPLRSVVTRENLKILLSGRGLFGRFGYLVVTQVVTVLIGVGYWALSARSIPATQVGIAAAAVAGATLIAAIGVLGVNTVIIVEIKQLRAIDQRAFVTTGILVSSPIVAALTFGVWGMSRFLGPSLRTIGHSPLDALLMVLGAVVTSITGAYDSAALGLGKSPSRLARNILASGLKVAFVGVIVAVGQRTAAGLLIGWNVSLILSLVTYPRMLKLERVAVSLAKRRAFLKNYWRLSLGHHAVNLSLGFMGFILPVIAALFILPKEVAYFSVAQLIATNSVALPFLLSMSLFVETAGDAELLRTNVRKTFPMGLACAIVVLAVFEPTANIVLGVFSHTYAVHGTTPLRLLLIAGLPYVFKDHFVAIRRAQNRLTEAAKWGVASTALEVAAAAIGAALGGLDWLCAGWVIAASIEALCFLPSIIVVLRSDGSKPRTAPPGRRHSRVLS